MNRMRCASIKYDVCTLAPRSARGNYATRRDILDVGLTRMGTALDVAAMSARDRSRG